MLLKDIESLSKDIKQLREEVKLYESIRIRSVTMKDKLHSIYVEEHQQQKQALKKDERLKQV